MMKRMMSKAIRQLVILLFFLNGIVQNSIAAQDISPKREFRAVWIATVGNIDWPSKPGLSAQQQQQEFINRLDFLQRCGFNAVIVQVRPAADAFYESAFEPWSRYLTGKQGQPPFPRYDPLEFMIREAHQRNMELHAWFNPYRALVNSAVNPNPPDHATRKHPDWIIRYGTKSYFDPGNPDARNYILNVLIDVVRRYDIDALHIDDYFYPYPEKGKAFPDDASFKKYNNNLSRADWRRNNVNTFISQLNRMIKAEKPWVRFGVSPFGIWRNKSQSAEGSATRGTSCYDDLYSDVRLWLQNKWVDYVAPQLYWEHYHRVAPFDVLLPWWVDNAFGRNLYIGLGVYRMVNGSGPWSGTTEILRQIKASRDAHTGGVVMYSMASFDKIGPALADSLQHHYFKHIAIPPASPWLGDGALPPAPILNIKTERRGNVVLNWENNAYDNKELKYIVYRFSGDEIIDLENAANILAFTRQEKFTDTEASLLKNVRYVVTSLDRIGVESKPSNIVSPDS